MVRASATRTFANTRALFRAAASRSAESVAAWPMLTSSFLRRSILGESNEASDGLCVGARVNSRASPPGGDGQVDERAEAKRRELHKQRAKLYPKAPALVG